MKKFLAVVTLLVLGSMCEAAKPQQKKSSAPTPKKEQKQQTRKTAPSADDISADEEAACQRVANALRDRYSALEIDGVPLHVIIEQAFQEVANEHREDFEVAKYILGVPLQEDLGDLEAGTWIVPIPINFIVF